MKRKWYLKDEPSPDFSEVCTFRPKLTLQLLETSTWTSLFRIVF